METTYNLAINSSYRLVIASFPDVVFFAQKNPIPSIQTVFPTLQGPQLAYAMPPSALVYGPFTVDFLIDEDLTNYRALVDWSQSSLTATPNNVYSDISLVIMDNARNNVVQTANFVNAFPMNISELIYEVDVNEAVYLKASVNFRYDSYKFI